VTKGSGYGIPEVAGQGDLTTGYWSRASKFYFALQLHFVDGEVLGHE